MPSPPRWWRNAVLLGAVVLPVALVVGSRGPTPPRVLPRYTRGGGLIRPDGVERWVLVGASLGLGYDADDRSGGPGMFHNVYLEPGAYAEYIRSGRFPDQTILAMTMYGPAERVPPLQRGWFEGGFMGLEVAVKDPKRFEGRWAYFVFGTGGPGAEARALPRAACQRCHAAHAARDNVFVQFYPVLRPRLASGGFSR